MSTFIAFWVSDAKISPLVWSGVVGAVIALIGVMINNWFTLKSEARKLVAAAGEKSLDRTMTLRKEVYLPLATTMQQALTFLGSLPSVKAGEMGPLKEFAAAAARLHVVAETPTALLANHVSTQLAIAFFDLSAAARPAVEALDDAECAKEHLQEAKNNLKVAQQDMDKFLRTATIDDRVFGALDRNTAAYRKDVARCGKEVAKALALHARHTIKFSHVLIEKMPVLGELSSSMTLAIRRDLGQISDEAAFEASLKENQAKMTIAMQATLADLEESIVEEQE